MKTLTDYMPLLICAILGILIYVFFIKDGNNPTALPTGTSTATA